MPTSTAESTDLPADSREVGSGVSTQTTHPHATAVILRF